MGSRLLERGRFDRLWSRLGPVGGGGEAFDELVARYGEPHRVYHTAEHIRDCLHQLDDASLEPTDAVEAAIWYHDAVYDSHREDNEARSADLAERHLAPAGVPGTLTKEIRRLILTTRHDEDPTDPSAELVCDVDLSILGRPPEQFEEFERRIRAEYAWVSEAHYRQVRSEILSGFLARANLYHTMHFRNRYEQSARRNLRKAIATLNR